MPKTPAQSDFVYRSPPRDADAAERGAPPTATRWVLRVTVVLLLALFVLVAIALHIPRGE